MEQSNNNHGGNCSGCHQPVGPNMLFFLSVEVYHWVEHSNKVADSVLKLVGFVVFLKFETFVLLVVQGDERKSRHDVHFMTSIACEYPFVHDSIVIDVLEFRHIDLVNFWCREAKFVFKLCTFAWSNYFLNDRVNKVEILSSFGWIVIVLVELETILEILKLSVEDFIQLLRILDAVKDVEIFLQVGIDSCLTIVKALEDTDYIFLVHAKFAVKLLWTMVTLQRQLSSGTWSCCFTCTYFARSVSILGDINDSVIELL